MYDLTFIPKKEEELIDLLAEGDGDFEVISAERTESKNGNPMIKMSLKVWDKNGEHKFIYDYLMLTDKKYSLRRIRHFCYSCGLGELYECGKINASDCVGKAGKLKIGIQKDKNGQYCDKNIVTDYITDTSDLKDAVSVLNHRRNNQFADLPPVDAYDDIPV